MPGNYKITSREEKISLWLPPIIPLNILALESIIKNMVMKPPCPVRISRFCSLKQPAASPVTTILCASCNGPDMVDYEAELAVVVMQVRKKYKA